MAENIKRYLRSIPRKLTKLCEQGITNITFTTELDFEILHQTCIQFDEIREDQWVQVFEQHNPDVVAYVIRLIFKIHNFLTNWKVTSRVTNAFMALKLQLEDFWMSGFLGALLTSTTYEKIQRALKDLELTLYDPGVVTHFENICTQFGIGKNHNFSVVNGQLLPNQLIDSELLKYVKEDDNTYTTNLINISLDHRPLLKKTVSRLPIITLEQVMIGIYDQAKHMIGKEVQNIRKILVISGDEEVLLQDNITSRALTFGWRVRHFTDRPSELVLSHNCIFHMLKVLVGNNYKLDIYNEEGNYFILRMDHIAEYRKPAWTSNYLHYIFNFCGIDLYFDYLTNFPVVKNGFYGAPQIQQELGEQEPLTSQNPFLTVYNSEGAIYLEDVIIKRIAINTKVKHLAAQLLFPVHLSIGAEVVIADNSLKKRHVTADDINDTITSIVATYKGDNIDGIILWDFTLDFRQRMEEMQAVGLNIEDFKVIWRTGKMLKVNRDIRACGKRIETLDGVQRVIVLITGKESNDWETSVIADMRVINKRLHFTGNSLKILSQNNLVYTISATGKWVAYVNGDFYLPKVTLLKDFNQFRSTTNQPLGDEIFPLDLEEYIAKTEAKVDHYSRDISWIGLLIKRHASDENSSTDRKASYLISQLLGMILVTYPKFWFFLDAPYSTAFGTYLHRTAADTGPMFNEKVSRERFFSPLYEFYINVYGNHSNATFYNEETFNLADAYPANDAIHNTIAGWTSSFVDRITFEQVDPHAYISYEVQIHLARILTFKCPDSSCFKCKRIYPLSSIRCACRHLHKANSSANSDCSDDDSREQGQEV